jgi:hypothetical protein
MPQGGHPPHHSITPKTKIYAGDIPAQLAKTGNQLSWTASPPLANTIVSPALIVVGKGDEDGVVPDWR